MFSISTKENILSWVYLLTLEFYLFIFKQLAMKNSFL